jgi:hypothetical protein
MTSILFQYSVSVYYVPSYCSSMFDIVMIDNELMHKITKRLLE